MDQARIAAVFGKLDSAVFVLTAADGDRRNGQIVAWVLPASIIPQFPRVVVGVGLLTYTRELIEGSRRFALNLLGRDQWRWVPHFGFRSGRDVDKFAAVPFERGMTGSPILTGTVGYLECVVKSTMDAGPYVFYLADVLAGQIVADQEPLCLHQLPELLPPEDVATMKRLLEQDIMRHLALPR